MRARVPVELDGERADLVVARVAGVSRSIARQLLIDGGAMVDGAPAVPRDRLSAGTELEIEVPEPLPLLEAELVDFEVRYEDSHLAVIEKPAGLVVHPG
ncbi:MAG: RNA pseudouridine synthase, partial [Acidimicrobiia bacterium]|nr:RNA pseudouridine synthase [Acidimicrobiia bacterium]